MLIAYIFAEISRKTAKKCEFLTKIVHINKLKKIFKNKKTKDAFIKFLKFHLKLNI